ncbi:MAG: phytanoyl-CoA dioxygenase [Planctomycetia bacterium]|nr:phytanoyl-CoA dioxygenase [Planctomycetia bacterium]
MSLDTDGYALAPGLYSASECAELIASLEKSLNAADPAIRGGDGAIYAARNLLSLWTQARTFWRIAPVRAFLTAHLGPSCGLVRVLYFDKPPGNSWALPWHKDLTVAVRDNALTSTRFSKPTTKSGVPHVEAPLEVLRRMLTLRVHLDEVTDENGPLKVLPGSHHTDKTLDLRGEVRVLHAAAGAGLWMRPLLAHCSNRSSEGTTRHRRIIHLEFAADETLPDGYSWYTWERVNKD